MIDFEGFGKIARLTRMCTVTEKIDGTNACIYISEDGEFLTGSRTRWITPDADNQGFSKWAHENRDELMQLGVGKHFGEWWGQGIQRAYGQDRKRFSLFNTSMWASSCPECCDVVPVLYDGVFDTRIIEDEIYVLRREGSMAAPGFTRPEGVIIYHHAANIYFKKTCEKDVEWKGVQK